MKIIFQRLRNSLISIPTGSIKITAIPLLYLNSTGISIPTGSIKILHDITLKFVFLLFQFQLVRLKYDQHLERNVEYKFQFQLVRLKFSSSHLRCCPNIISIPTGSIKIAYDYDTYICDLFQFQLVRLK